MRLAGPPTRTGHRWPMQHISRPAASRMSAKSPGSDPCSNQQQQMQPMQQQQSAAPQFLQAASTVPRLMAEPSTCLSALAGFTLIASNIPVSSADDAGGSALQQLLASSSGAAQAASMDAVVQPAAGLSNPILQLDNTIHQFVASHTTEAFRLMADVWISDAFITAGVLGWVAATAACMAKAPSKAAGPLAAAWGFYFATCGAVGHGDPLLVDTLKHAFARARPSTLHHTFSFPSGHTSAAVFIVGGLLTVLVPLTLHLWTSQSAFTTDSSSSSTSATTALVRVAAVDAAILAVWGSAWATTAAGRILSESHWLSDTLAGGLLAVASVSALACCSRLLLPQASGSGTGSRKASSLGDS